MTPPVDTPCRQRSKAHFFLGMSHFEIVAHESAQYTVRKHSGIVLHARP